MADRIADIWGADPAREGHGVAGPGRPAPRGRGRTEEAVDRWVQSACLLCSNGCGCDIAVKDGRMVGVRGRAGDVVNHGRLGPKGLYGSTPWASSAGPADPAAGPRGRAAGGDRLGDRDGPHRRGVASGCWTRRAR